MVIKGIHEGEDDAIRECRKYRDSTQYAIVEYHREL